MENRPPNVFVSSALYDLIHLRGRLREFIEGLGWRAVIAERGSFPIDANETTVENSLSNVQDNADIFVMIVGARYGSVTADTARSDINLEFGVARACGVPVYVFVESSVRAQLSVWRSNPDADYSGVVDTPRVFEFIDSFYGSGEVGTFSFASADEIVDTLRQQFAYLVQDALGLRQMTRDNDRLLEELEGNALMLALRGDDYWEYRLFGTVLEAELDRRASLRREIEHRLAPAEVTSVGLADFLDWVQDRLSECAGFGHTVEAIFRDYLPQAAGEEGVPGDPLEIVATARRLAQLWEDIAQWTLRCRSVRVDRRAERAVELLSRTTANALDEIWDFGHRLSRRLEEAIEKHAESDTELVIEGLTLTVTADLDEFNKEITRFRKRLTR